ERAILTRVITRFLLHLYDHMPSLARRRSTRVMTGYGKRWFSGFVLLLISTAGVLIALQGWKSRVPVFDLVPHMEDARQFVLSATVPKKGILTSLASYTPPGTTWLLVPGVYLVDEPRLYESIGTATLYLGTVVGIFILARGWFGD